MRLRQPLISFLILWLGTAGVSLAATPEEPFGVGAESVGMGGIVATASKRNAALFGNPSFLSDVERPSFFVDASQGAFSAGLPLGKFGALSAGALDLCPTDRFLLEDSWNPLGTFITGDNRASVGYAYRTPRRQFAFGATLDAWRDTEDNWTPGAGIGVSASPTRYVRFGVTALSRETAKPSIRYGFAVEPSPKFQFHAEGGREQVAFGVASDWKYLSLRAGTRLFAESSDRVRTYSGGGSIHLPNGWNFHYGYEFADEDAQQGTHFLSLELPLWGQPPRERRFPAVPDWLPDPERIVRSAVDKKPDIPPEAQRSLRKLIEHHSQKYSVEIPLILAKMRTESSFDPKAVSTSKAVGLFQLLPPAARDMGIDLKDEDILTEQDPRFNPIINADAGIRYLAHLLNRFGWNYVLATAGYNAGPGRIQGEVPPIRETERHVGKVLNFYYQYKNNPKALEEAWEKIDAIRIP